MALYTAVFFPVTIPAIPLVSEFYLILSRILLFCFHFRQLVIVTHAVQAVCEALQKM